ncbi:MAG TPA: hypothetical protein DCY13_12295 [Verrucomicrobiales bacterium]|nr:hypothetical protein [Verrucomicrobiales bacterium]
MDRSWLQLRSMNGALFRFQINQRIRRMADGERVHCLDINDAFLETDGSLSKEMIPDFRYLGEAGYQRWAKAIEPTPNQLGL